MNLAAEESNIEKHNTSGRRYRTYLLWALISTLAFLNIFIAFPLASASQSIAELKIEIDEFENQNSELELLKNRHLYSTTALTSSIKWQMRELHEHCETADEFFPILEDTFVRFDGDLRTSGLKTYLAVPRTGTHQLRVLVENYAPDDQTSEVLSDKKFDLQSAKGYQFEFVLLRSGLRVSLSDIAEFEVDLGGKQFEKSALSVQPKNRTFFCPNEPHWHRNTGVFSQTGLVEDLAFLQTDASLRYLRVRVYVKSDGPITSAPDDRETVRNLIWGASRTEVPHQFKDGKYIFPHVHEF